MTAKEGVQQSSGGKELGREDRGKEGRSCGRLKAIGPSSILSRLSDHQNGGSK